MKQINILYVIGQLNIGGAEKQLLQLVAHINRDKFNPIVCSLSSKNSLLDDFKETSSKVYVVTKKWRRIPQILRIIKREEIDIVHTWLFVANAWGRVAGTLARLLFPRKDLKIIISEREMPELRSNFYLWIDKILARFCDLILINTEAGKEKIQRIYRIPEARINVVYNGINLNEAHPIKKKEEIFNQLGLPPTAKIVGTVANLTPVKNYKLFLDIAKKILEKREYVFFVALGDGPLKEALNAYKEKLGITNKVLFLGQKRNIYDFLNIMDIFTLTSKTEGCSNAILEAMAMKKPVVVTRVRGNAEIIEDGKTGFLFGLNDPDEACSWTEFLLDNETIKSKMGEEAYKKIREKWTVDKMVQKIEKVYLDLTGGNFTSRN